MVKNRDEMKLVGHLIVSTNKASKVSMVNRSSSCFLFFGLQRDKLKPRKGWWEGATS